MKFKSCVSALSCVLALSSTSVQAEVIPVIDDLNIAQATKQIDAMADDAIVQNELLQKAKDQHDLLTKQSNQLKSIYDQFSNTRSILGMLLPDGLNGLLDGNFSSTSGVLSTLMNGANGQWTGFTDQKSPAITANIKKSLGAAGLSSALLSKWTSSGEPIQQRIAQQAAGGAMLAATAEQSYREAEESLSRVQMILKETRNSIDIKASIDNNTRMLAELSIQLAKTLEITSTEAVYNGQVGVNAAAERAEERKFFTFGNAR